MLPISCHNTSVFCLKLIHNLYLFWQALILPVSKFLLILIEVLKRLVNTLSKNSNCFGIRLELYYKSFIHSYIFLFHCC